MTELSASSSYTRLRREADAQFDPVRLRWLGCTMTVTPRREWSPATIAALRGGDVLGWVEGALDERSRARFDAADPTGAQMQQLLDLWCAAAGHDLVEVAQLVAFLDQYGGQVEVDLRRYFHLELADLHTGHLTDRLAWLLIRQLPPESATMTGWRDSIGDDELDEREPSDSAGHGPWSHEAMILARLVDEVAALRYVLVAVNTTKAARPSFPDPLPRPGVRRRGAPGRPAGRQFEARLAAFRAGVPDPAIAAIEAMREQRRQMNGDADG